MANLYLGFEKVLTLDDREGSPGTLYKIDNPELLPFALRNECTNEAFERWFYGRTIPSNREGLADVIAIYGDRYLKNKNYASLSDNYWIQTRTEAYNKVSYFKNPYGNVIGDMFFAPWQVDIKQNASRVASPDLTTGGRLRKTWKRRADGTSYLVKACGLTTRQEPLSEVLVSVLLNRIGIASANYSLCVEGVNICCQCDNFVTEHTNLVTAAELLNYRPNITRKPIYSHLLSICDELGIEGAQEYIDTVILVDYLTFNFDRKLSDIGFLYDFTKRKFMGPAPIYDCAASYWSGGDFDCNMKDYLFHENATEVLCRVKQKVDLTPIGDDYYSNLILKYPDITEENRERMIKEIEENNRFFLERDITREDYEDR